MKRMTKSLAVLLAVLLMLTGCQTDTSWVYAYGDNQTMPAGVYIYFLMTSFDEAFNTLYNLEMEAYMEAFNAQLAAQAENPDAEMEEIDEISIYDLTYKELLDQELEGMSVNEWATQNAQKLARRYMATELKLQELGISLSDEEVALYKNNAHSAFQNASYGYDLDNNIVSGEKFFAGSGISENSLALANQFTPKMQLLFETLYGEGGEYEVAEDEIVTYFTENYIRGQQLVIKKPSESDLPTVSSGGEEELTEEQQAVADLLAESNASTLTAMQQDTQLFAEDLYKKFEEGTAIEDLAMEYDEYQGEENPLRNMDGAYDFIVLNDDYSDHGQDVVDGVNALAVGETALLDLDAYYILIKRLDLLEDPEDLEEHRSGVLIDLRYNDTFLPLLDEWGDAVSCTVNQNSINRYTAATIRK